MLLLTKLQSLPVTKKIGAKHILAVSLSKVKWPGVFIATGSHTFFGKTAKLVASAGGESHAQKAMFKIGNFLIVVAIILALIMVGFRVIWQPTHSALIQLWAFWRSKLIRRNKSNPNKIANLRR